MNEDDDEAELDESERPEDRPERAPARVAVFDLPSLFWTVAKAREGREGREKGPEGAALAALRHARDLTERLGCDRACFAHERRPYWREAASVQGRAWEADGTHSTLTGPLIPYKAGRPKKDPKLVAELAALSAALSVSGFQVFVVEEGRPLDPDEPGGGQGSDGPRPTFFEADDVAASLAKRISDAGCAAVVVSNDHDLAQVLALPEAAEARIWLARVSGGDVGRYVLAEDVRRDFGVPLEKLADFLALAGDGDFKPYPGAERGPARRAAGIGEAGARELLEVFGSFEAAVACANALSPPDASKTLLRALALLKAGGRERAECAGLLARVRFNVPLAAEDVAAVLGEPGSWGEAEAALKDADKQRRAEAARAAIRAELLPRLEVPVGGDVGDAAFTLTYAVSGAELDCVRAMGFDPSAISLDELVRARERGLLCELPAGTRVPIARADPLGPDRPSSPAAEGEAYQPAGAAETVRAGMNSDEHIALAAERAAEAFRALAESLGAIAVGLRGRSAG